MALSTSEMPASLEPKMQAQAYHWCSCRAVSELCGRKRAFLRHVPLHVPSPECPEGPPPPMLTCCSCSVACPCCCCWRALCFCQACSTTTDAECSQALVGFPCAVNSRIALKEFLLCVHGAQQPSLTALGVALTGV